MFLKIGRSRNVEHDCNFQLITSLSASGANQILSE